MNVNNDFSRRVVVHGSQQEWEDSPIAGVRRRRLDRVAGYLDRVTTIVDIGEKSALSTHTHTGGEELLVLDGSFEDDHGFWPVGSYVRNPPGSAHTPHSETGSLILVKMCQIDSNDKTVIHANINKLEYIEPKDREGVASASLYKSEHESVRVEKWEPHANVEFTPEGGAEIFVIEGSATETNDELEPQSWLRLPVGDKVSAKAGPEGALVWIKTNHLKNQ